MAIELHIFLHDSRVPSTLAWQQAIDRLEFPTVLDPAIDARQHTGFWPTTYAGQSTGFEFYLEPVAELLSAYPHVADRVGSRDMCATFRWLGDMTEMAAALFAAASLAKLTDGIYYYPDDDILYDGDGAVEATRRDLSSL